MRGIVVQAKNTVKENAAATEKIVTGKKILKAELEAEIDKIRSSRDEILEKYNMLQEKYVKDEKLIKKLTASLHKLEKTKAKDLKNGQENFESQLKRSVSIAEGLKNKVESLNKSLLITENENTELTKRNTQLEVEINNLQSALSTKATNENQLKELALKNSELSISIQYEQKAHAEYEKNIQKLESQIQEQKQVVDEKISENKELLQKIHELESQKLTIANDKQMQMHSFEVSRQQNELKIQSLEKENQEKMNNIENLQKQIEEIQKQNDEKSIQLSNALEEAHKDLCASRTMNEEMENNNELQITSIKHEHQIQLENIKFELESNHAKEIESLKEKHSMEIQNIKNENQHQINLLVEKFGKEIESLRSQYENGSVAIQDTLLTQIDALKTEIAATTSPEEVEMMKNHIKNLETQNENYKQTILKLNKRIEDLLDLLLKSEKLINRLRLLSVEFSSRDNMSNKLTPLSIPDSIESSATADSQAYSKPKFLKPGQESISDSYLSPQRKRKKTERRIKAASANTSPIIRRNQSPVTADDFYDEIPSPAIRKQDIGPEVPQTVFINTVQRKHKKEQPKKAELISSSPQALTEANDLLGSDLEEIYGSPLPKANAEQKESFSESEFKAQNSAPSEQSFGNDSSEGELSPIQKIKRKRRHSSKSQMQNIQLEHSTNSEDDEEDADDESADVKKAQKRRPIHNAQRKQKANRNKEITNEGDDNESRNQSKSNFDNKPKKVQTKIPNQEIRNNSDSGNNFQEIAKAPNQNVKTENPKTKYVKGNNQTKNAYPNGDDEEEDFSINFRSPSDDEQIPRMKQKSRKQPNVLNKENIIKANYNTDKEEEDVTEVIEPTVKAKKKYQKEEKKDDNALYPDKSTKPSKPIESHIVQKDSGSSPKPISKPKLHIEDISSKHPGFTWTEQKELEAQKIPHNRINSEKPQENYVKNYSKDTLEAPIPKAEFAPISTKTNASTQPQKRRRSPILERIVNKEIPSIKMNEEGPNEPLNEQKKGKQKSDDLESQSSDGEEFLIAEQNLKGISEEQPPRDIRKSPKQNKSHVRRQNKLETYLPIPPEVSIKGDSSSQSEYDEYYSNNEPIVAPDGPKTVHMKKKAHRRTEPAKLNQRTEELSPLEEESYYEEEEEQKPTPEEIRKPNKNTKLDKRRKPKNFDKEHPKTPIQGSSDNDEEYYISESDQEGVESIKAVPKKSIKSIKSSKNNKIIDIPNAEVEEEYENIQTPKQNKPNKAKIDKSKVYPSENEPIPEQSKDIEHQNEPKIAKVQRSSSPIPRSANNQRKSQTSREYNDQKVGNSDDQQSEELEDDKRKHSRNSSAKGSQKSSPIRSTPNEAFDKQNDIYLSSSESDENHDNNYEGVKKPNPEKKQLKDKAKSSKELTNSDAIFDFISDPPQKPIIRKQSKEDNNEIPKASIRKQSRSKSEPNSDVELSPFLSRNKSLVRPKKVMPNDDQKSEDNSSMQESSLVPQEELLDQQIPMRRNKNSNKEYKEQIENTLSKRGTDPERKQNASAPSQSRYNKPDSSSLTKMPQYQDIDQYSQSEEEKQEQGTTPYIESLPNKNRPKSILKKPSDKKGTLPYSDTYEGEFNELNPSTNKKVQLAHQKKSSNGHTEKPLLKKEDNEEESSSFDEIPKPNLEGSSSFEEENTDKKIPKFKFPMSAKSASKNHQNESTIKDEFLNRSEEEGKSPKRRPRKPVSTTKDKNENSFEEEKSTSILKKQNPPTKRVDKSIKRSSSDNEISQSSSEEESQEKDIQKHNQQRTKESFIQPEESSDSDLNNHPRKKNEIRSPTPSRKQPEKEQTIIEKTKKAPKTNADNESESMDEEDKNQLSNSNEEIPKPILKKSTNKQQEPRNIYIPIHNGNKGKKLKPIDDEEEATSTKKYQQKPEQIEGENQKPVIKKPNRIDREKNERNAVIVDMSFESDESGDSFKPKSIMKKSKVDETESSDGEQFKPKPIIKKPKTIRNNSDEEVKNSELIQEKKEFSEDEELEPKQIAKKPKKVEVNFESVPNDSDSEGVQTKNKIASKKRKHIENESDKSENYERPKNTNLKPKKSNQSPKTIESGIVNKHFKEEKELSGDELDHISSPKNVNSSEGEYDEFREDEDKNQRIINSQKKAKLDIVSDKEKRNQGNPKVDKITKSESSDNDEQMPRSIIKRPKKEEIEQNSDRKDFNQEVRTSKSPKNIDKKVNVVHESESSNEEDFNPVTIKKKPKKVIEELEQSDEGTNPNVTKKSKPKNSTTNKSLTNNKYNKDEETFVPKPIMKNKVVTSEPDFPDDDETNKNNIHESGSDSDDGFVNLRTKTEPKYSSSQSEEDLNQNEKVEYNSDKGNKRKKYKLKSEIKQDSEEEIKPMPMKKPKIVINKNNEENIGKKSRNKNEKEQIKKPDKNEEEPSPKPIPERPKITKRTSLGVAPKNEKGKLNLSPQEVTEINEAEIENLIQKPMRSDHSSSSSDDSPSTDEPESENLEEEEDNMNEKSNHKKDSPKPKSILKKEPKFIAHSNPEDPKKVKLSTSSSKGIRIDEIPNEVFHNEENLPKKSNVRNQKVKASEMYDKDNKNDKQTKFNLKTETKPDSQSSEDSDKEEINSPKPIKKDSPRALSPGPLSDPNDPFKRKAKQTDDEDWSEGEGEGEQVIKRVSSPAPKPSNIPAKFSKGFQLSGDKQALFTPKIYAAESITDSDENEIKPKNQIRSQKKPRNVKPERLFVDSDSESDQEIVKKKEKPPKERFKEEEIPTPKIRSKEPKSKTPFVDRKKPKQISFISADEAEKQLRDNSDFEDDDLFNSSKRTTVSTEIGGLVSKSFGDDRNVGEDDSVVEALSDIREELGLPTTSSPKQIRDKVIKMSRVTIVRRGEDEAFQPAIPLERKPSEAYFERTKTPRIIKAKPVAVDLKREIEEMQEEIAKMKKEINDSRIEI